MVNGLVLVLVAGLRAEAPAFPKIDMRPPRANYSFLQTRLSTSSFTFDEGKQDAFQMDFRNCDLSSYDLKKNRDILYSSFNTKTIFPKALPGAFDPAKILELGKNPGLGIRQLHRDGITGRGVGIAILDQSLLTEHVEYADRLRLYEQIHCLDQDASMHGAAVASIAAGKTVGVAPGANLYFIGMTNGEYAKGGFAFDLGYVAQGIDRVMEINKRLAKADRIRVVSISLSMGRSWKNYDKAIAAIARAEKAGVWVLTVDDEKFRLDGMERPPLADPEAASSYEGGIMFTGNRRGAASGILQIPMDSRTVADPNGQNEYFFSRIGGQSWIVPWVAGLYALACQARPDVTPALFWKTALETAGTASFQRDGKVYKLEKVVDPVSLMRRLKPS